MRRTPGAVVECDRGAQRGASIADKGHFRDKWDIFAVQNREPEFARGHIGEGRVEVYPHFPPRASSFHWPSTKASILKERTLSQ